MDARIATIRDAVAAVQNFHTHLNIAPPGVINESTQSLWIENLGREIVRLSKVAETQDNGQALNAPNMLSAHLLAEEVGEALIALGQGNEIEFLDGLADLLYIICGRAAQFNLPLAEAFWEVHRSNMTKEKQPTDPGAARVRQKGPNYSPPDLISLLEEHRKS
jgi:predicted HAD superfamily Cof-like phosphohydrolase